MITAAVAIGSNLGDPIGNLLAGEQHILSLPRSFAFRFSPIYRTAPVDSPGSPFYLNAAVAFQTGLDAETLLLHLLEIEARQERERPYRNAPRTLDLDLILYGDAVIDTDRLVVPHPRFHTRFFVLAPLNDLLPEARHPAMDLRVGELLARLRAEEDFASQVSRFEGSFRSTVERS